ncbi:MAG TPA: rhodanese-like domain-containing protein [Longimicrobiales bacterium]|nr:rhodanese-like domain-containing protein [Longimicrobiales bacterium]
MQIRILAAMLGAGLLLACDSGAMQEESPAAEPGAEVVGSTVDRAVADLFVDDTGASAQLVFVADRMSQAARDAGAVFLPLSTFSVERDGIPNEFPAPDSMAATLEAAGIRGGRILIVGAPIPAGRAYAAFDYLGLGDRAALLEGGPAALAATPAADRRTAPGEDAAELDVDVRDDMIVDAGWVHDRLDDPNVVILDARPPAEFSGETPGEGIDRPGHIPGAHNVFWQTLVESPDAPRLKDEAELRRIFEQAGVGPDDTVVAYCRTGGQASFLYTVAKHLGYDVRLYDGSYVDWSRTEYPVER